MGMQMSGGLQGFDFPLQASVSESGPTISRGAGSGHAEEFQAPLHDS